MNPNANTWERYGGRGITLCKEWLDDFPAFLAHIGRRPSPEHSVERIDNSKGYEPGNVKWATRGEQGRNKRNNIHLTINGETKIIAEWARITGQPRHVIKQRIDAGYAPDVAISPGPLPYDLIPKRPRDDSGRFTVEGEPK